MEQQKQSNEKPAYIAPMIVELGSLQQLTLAHPCAPHQAGPHVPGPHQPIRCST